MRPCKPCGPLVPRILSLPLYAEATAYQIVLTYRCHFCGRRLFGRFLLTARPPGGVKSADMYALCTEHFDVLKAAGAWGQVYRPTGRAGGWATLRGGHEA